MAKLGGTVLTAMMTVALTISVCGFVAVPTARAAVTTEYTEVGSEPIVDGVTHEWGTAQTDTAPQRLNVVHVAHDAADVQFGLGLPDDRVDARERTTLQAVADTSPGHRVVAAINGDFWQKTDLVVAAPSGLDVRAGELVAGNALENRGAFGVRPDGTTMIGTPQLSVSVSFPGDVTLNAAGVNRVRGADELVVYTPRFGPSTKTDTTGVEVRLVGAALPLTAAGTYTTTVAAVLPDAGDTTFSSGDLVLSASGSAADALRVLKVGDAVTVQTSMDPDWQDVQTAVGGLLLFNGDVTPDYPEPKYTADNPRTAIGVTTDGDVLLVTVDGRSVDSGGIALADLVDVLRHMGAVSAINLDGGGSTTMAVDPAGDAPLALANQVSTRYERHVNTTLQVISTARDAPSVSAPTASIVPDVATGTHDAKVHMSWTADAASSVARTRLQQLGGDGLWHDITLADPRATGITRRFEFGRHYQFRVRVTDGTGATSDWAISPTFVLERFNESDPRVARQGEWRVHYRSSAIGNHIATSAYDGTTETLSLNTTGIEVAVVAEKRAAAGIARVSLGGSAAAVDLYSSGTAARMVVFVGSPVGQISVANAGSVTRPYVDIDAFLVLTTT